MNELVIAPSREFRPAALFTPTPKAKAEMKMPETKKGVYLRVDPEVLTWFQKAGKGYQTRINAVLRSYVETQKGRPAR
jgi:uncharacterized protein (DUF4415 family)